MTCRSGHNDYVDKMSRTHLTAAQAPCKRPAGPGRVAARPAAEESVFSTAGRTDRVGMAVPMGHGAAEARIVPYIGDGKGVWKALRGAPHPETGRYMHDGHSEVAADRLARLLGVAVVPETVYDAHGGGTSQQFLERSFVGAKVSVRSQRELATPARGAIVYYVGPGHYHGEPGPAPGQLCV